MTFIIIALMCLPASSSSSIIEQLQKKNADQGTDAPTADHVRQLSTLIGQKDQELQV